MKIFTKAALVADSLNLGPHWIYNQTKLTRLYPNGVTTFSDPASNYHPKRKAGQLTHIGDQLHYLHQSIEKNSNSYTFDQWKTDWLEKMSNYDGYIDGATKTTLSNKAETPSQSDEASGAARLAPLIDLDLSLEATIESAKSHAGLTHGSPQVSELSEFIVRAAFAIKGGLSFIDSFKQAAQEGQYTVLDPLSHIDKALNADTSNHLKTAADFGLTCHFPEAFPLILFYAIHHGDNFSDCISKNALAGGDNSARAIALSIFFAARDGDVGQNLFPNLLLESDEYTATPSLQAGSNNVTFSGPQGLLSGVLEMPESQPTATAIFAHCFTCGKDFLPERRITKALSERGIATLRIDFSGLGNSEGSFAESSFLTNLDDLKTAAEWLKENVSPPALLVGHSLGGAAVLAAARSIASVKAVATIGAPADPAHVTHLFDQHLSEIEQNGQATVKLAGRSFNIGKRFLDDLSTHNQEQTLNQLQGTATLIMHSPDDDTVPLSNAGHIYSALPHPKSFISLAGADHLLTKPKDAEYVADLIKTWATKSIES